MISNADMTGTLRSQKSQSWEVVEPTLTQEPSVFSEICRDRRPSCLPSGVCGLMVDVQVLVVDPRGKKPEGVNSNLLRPTKGGLLFLGG